MRPVCLSPFSLVSAYPRPILHDGAEDHLGEYGPTTYRHFRDAGADVVATSARPRTVTKRVTQISGHMRRDRCFPPSRWRLFASRSGITHRLRWSALRTPGGLRQEVVQAQQTSARPTAVRRRRGGADPVPAGIGLPPHLDRGPRRSWETRSWSRCRRNVAIFLRKIVDICGEMFASSDVTTACFHRRHGVGELRRRAWTN